MSSTLEWLRDEGNEDEKKVVVKTNLSPMAGEPEAADVLQHVEDITAAIKRKERVTAREIVVAKRRPASGTLSYGVQTGLRGRSNIYRDPFHDYSEIARAVDTESFLARSIQKHREYVLKEDWEYIGHDPEAVKYIKRRLFNMELATGKTTREWVRETVTNLITYSSAFLVLKRDWFRSEGDRIRLHGKKMDPVAGVFPMDPVSVSVKQNNGGRPIEWKQQIQGRTKKFDADDVVAITIDRKSGFVFGTPYCITVLDDIRALRRLEELVEMVSHKHLFPLFHVTVGTDKNPAQDVEYPGGGTISEVELARSQIQEMPAEGGLVTSERFTLELLGADGKVLDLQPYLNHFKERVMMGLRLSPLDLGAADTGNKATAQVVNRNLVDAVKDFQGVIADFVTSQLFDILLLEGGFDLTEETRVSFRFPTADREEERSQQQHGMTLYQSNAITHSEMRTEYLRKEPMTEEEDMDTWHEKYEKPVVEMQLDAQKEQARMSAANRGSSSSSSSSSKKDGSQKKSNSVKARPRNQFALSASKPSFPANDMVGMVMEEWNDTKVKVADKFMTVDDALKVFERRAIQLISIWSDKAVKDAVKDIKDDIIGSENRAKPFTHKTIKDNLQKILERTIIMLSEQHKNRAETIAWFDAIGVEIRTTAEYMYRAAQDFGRASEIKDTKC